MNRRNFIKSTCLACSGIVGIVSTMQSCSIKKHTVNSTYLEGNKISIKKSEFINEVNSTKKEKKFILIDQKRLQFPIALYKIKDESYNALYLECTHQGCELNAFETTLVCPCHGAEFNLQGDVTQGPADINLKTFVTTQDNENIYIQL